MVTESSLSNEASVTTPLPAPTAPTATVDTANLEVDLTWSLPDNSSDGGVRVERSSGGDPYQVLLDGSPSTTTYTDTNPPNEELAYRVKRDTPHATATSSATTTSLASAQTVFATIATAGSVSHTTAGAGSVDHIITPVGKLSLED